MRSVSQAVTPVTLCVPPSARLHRDSRTTRTIRAPRRARTTTCGQSPALWSRGAVGCRAWEKSTLERACLCAGATRLPNREPAFGERRPVTVAPPTCSAASPHRRDGDGRWAPPSPQPEADCSTRRAILASDTVPGGKSSVQERNVGQRRRVVSPRLALASLSPTGVLSMVHVHYCSCSSS